jgi:hypothetical protein
MSLGMVLVSDETNSGKFEYAQCYLWHCELCVVPGGRLSPTKSRIQGRAVYYWRKGQSEDEEQLMFSALPKTILTGRKELLRNYAV